MKFTYLILLFFLFTSCSSARLTNQWKNPDIDSYEPYKVLVVGLTSNIEARKKYEERLKEELTLRGAEAYSSLDVFKYSYIKEKLTEEEMALIEKDLIKENYDTIIFSKVVGVEDKIAYVQNFAADDETFVRFKEDYLRYQDIYYNPDYYEEYTVYHAETSMFCICPTKERELIWKGYVDIVDPHSTSSSVNDYVLLIIEVLEEQELISPVRLDIEKHPIR